jgi:integrase
MSVLFNHARRYYLYDRNPIQWVRQSAKRRSAPDVLTSNEVRQLLAALEPRERIMVLLDVATGLRQSELFALKWKDVDFKNKQLWVTRSIVQQVIGRCKTEASQKPVPLHDHLIRGLRNWRRGTPYRTPETWVFASPQNRGKNPYWGQQILGHHIRPVAQELGITKRIGWHTFRRTYSTLLRATGAELKVMQELMRHSTIRVTLHTYTRPLLVRSALRKPPWCRFSYGIRREARPASEEARSNIQAGIAVGSVEGAGFGTQACAYLVPFCAYAGMTPFL